jgi:electron transfer flavoprotein alpha/beta subunit
MPMSSETGAPVLVGAVIDVVRGGEVEAEVEVESVVMTLRLKLPIVARSSVDTDQPQLQ